QDRLWQMELTRRAGQGRLSEIFGERTFGTDIFLRTLDLYGHAERSEAALSPDVRRSLEAYARGVNAFLTRDVGLLEPRLPPEFLLLRHTPQPWRVADSLVTAKMMALNLSTNLNHEMTRLALAAEGLTSAEIEDLMPRDNGDAPPPLPELAQLYPLRRPAIERHAARDDVADMIGGGASNNWVVSGARTRSGKPLLANDPHLHLTAPATWYLAHLALVRPGAAAINVVGATLAGLPLVLLGRSDTLAWGFTNTGPDVQDVFIEKINPNDPKQYLAPDGWRPFVIEPMAIAVRGAGLRIVERRRTRHGPVLPGSYRNIEGLLAPGYVAALQWTALSDDDTTIAAGVFDPSVRGIRDYMERMRQYVVPMQSMVLADADGNIGMIAPGRVPMRQSGNQVAGRAPVPGWDVTYDWKGYLRFEDLPRLENPASGAIATANARIVGPDYPYHLTYDWDVEYRLNRIQQLILERGSHDPTSMRAAQADVLSLAFARLKPLMIAAARRAGSVDVATLDRLERWDGTMRADLGEPLIFMAWERETIRAIYRDDLGAAFEHFFATRALTLTRLLEGRATSRDWCDDRTTPEHETCDDRIAGALKAAMSELERRHGADPARWRWGPVHFAFGEHRPFGLVPGIAPFFNVEVPSPGDPYTLNRGIVDFADDPPFPNRGASTYRAIYDFADLEHSLYIQTTGQSGNPFSPFYRAFADRWAKVDYIEIPTKRAVIAKIATGTWRLTPP
ncbi:MAG: penicillin acylase family protein, partial [Hyphomicrobiaceae bacterium]|nr:penicillin acylase family protein [Hyphomicrobiaceae bacterium]